jgi:hypothetical protein
MPELQARLAAAAQSIEQEDRATGNHRRGTRQAATLLECTLKRRPMADVATELGLSARQLFRERQAAWTRAVHYLIAAEPVGPNEPSLLDVQCNYAMQLFLAGKRESGDALLGQLIREAANFEAFMLAALGAELHYQANDRTSALDFLAIARSLYTSAELERSALCRLTLTLLDELFETKADPLRKLRLNSDVVEPLVLERGVRWWMVRLAARLLITKYRLALAAHDRRGALRTAEAAIALGQRVPSLPAREAFNLRLLTARVDWMERGVTPRAEAALVENYLSASANGWISEVAHVSSLLASMMIIAGKNAGASYAQTALAVANTLCDEKTARFAHLNLAVAQLDAGRPDDAATVLADVRPPKEIAIDSDGDASGTEFALLAREVRAVTRAPAIANPFTARKKIDALAATDPHRAAYCLRVAALELERHENRRGAARLIEEAWEIVARDGDWMSHRTIGRTYRQLTRRPPQQ